MADNTTLNLGTGGDVIATDDIGGVKHQLVKLEFGAADSATQVSAVNPLPVVATNAGTFAVQAAQSGTWNTRLQDGSGNAITSAARGSERAATVQIVDAAGTQVTSFGGSGTPSAVSSVNSTAVVLAGGATFTGTSEDVTAYASITVAVIASHASATDGLSMQQSVDGTNWDIIDVYSVPAATGKTFGIQVSAKFFRLVYTNGATLQTSFRLQTMYHTNMQNSSSVRPQDARTNDNDMTEVIAYAAGFNGTTWDRLRSDTTNGLDVDVTRLPALVAGSATIGAVNIAAAQTLATVTTVGTVTSVTNVATIGTSVTPGTAATHLGKAEDAAHADGDVGVMALAVRRDANTTLASATGDYTPLQTDASGNLKVAIISGAGSGGTALADAAAFTRGTTSVTPFAGVVETSAPTVTNGNTTVASFTTGGALRVDVSSGGVAGVTEDAASAGAEQGILVMAVRRDTPASDVSAAGDFANLQVDSVGSQWVRNSNEIADDAAFTVGTSRVAPIGLMADETATDSVDEGDVGIPRMTLDRKQIVTPASHTAGGATPVSTVSAASTNATSLKASAGQVYSVTASNVNAAIRYLKFYNKASAPTVGTDTPVYVFPLPGNTAGAGITHSFPVGLEFTTGIAWALTTGAAVADTGAVSAAEHIVSIAYK